MAALAAPALAQEQPLPAVPPLPRRGPARKVVILGAGLAGLCAAYELTSQGHEVVVLEAQSRPGGRVRTLRENFAPGLYGEAGAETIPGAHELTQHYARTLGLTLLPAGVPGMRSIYHVRSRRIVPDDKAEWPFDLTAAERALGLAGLSKQYIDAAVVEAHAAGYQQQPVRSLAAWDKLTPGEWLLSKGASHGAAELLTLGFGLEFGSAASFLLHRLNSMGSRQRYRIEGGNDRLPAEFARRVDVRYATPVVAVTQDEKSVEVSTMGPRGHEVFTGDRVICTLPCPVIRTIFRQAQLSLVKERAIRELHYSRTVKIFLQTRTRFWLRQGLSGFVETDMPIERLTPDPGSAPDSRGALTAYPIGDYTASLETISEEERLDTAFAQASRIFPEMKQEYEGGVSKCWGLDPWQRGSFALHTPGQINFIAILARTEGRIHFAGEHTSHYTGWMQGALESARRTVIEIND